MARAQTTDAWDLERCLGKVVLDFFARSVAAWRWRKMACYKDVPNSRSCFSARSAVDLSDGSTAASAGRARAQATNSFFLEKRIFEETKEEQRQRNERV